MGRLNLILEREVKYMKIPKKIEKLIERRAKLAEELNHADNELVAWLDKKGLTDKVEEYDIMTGCEMYVNPYASADRIRAVIFDN